MLLIRAAWALFGASNIDAVVRLMLLLQTLAAAGVFYLGWRIHGPVCAGVAFALALAFTSPVGYALTVSNHWAAFPALVLASAWIALPSRGVAFDSGRALLMGALLGALVMLRNAALPLLGVWLLHEAIGAWRTRSRLAVMAAGLAGFAVVYAGTLGALSDRGFERTGHSLWFPVFVGTAEMGYLPAQDDGHGFAWLLERAPGIAYDSPEASRLYRDQVIEWFTENPGAFFATWWERFTHITRADREDWQRYPLPTTPIVSYLLYYFALVGFAVALLSPALDARGRYVLAFTTFGASVFLFEGVFILAKVPRYYFAWTTCYLLAVGVLASAGPALATSVWRQLTSGSKHRESET